MTALVVADTTVWSNFAHAGKPRLVPAAYPGVASPQKVLVISAGVGRGVVLEGGLRNRHPGVRRRRRLPSLGIPWAVVKRSEPIARGGRAAAVCGSRGEALRLAAVLPAVPRLNPYHLSDAPKRLGWPLHVNRRHVGHVSRLSKAEDAKAAGKKAWCRRQVLLTHLHVARYLAANPEALAQVAESMGPEALAALGRALARRVEAIVDPPAA